MRVYWLQGGRRRGWSLAIILGTWLGLVPGTGLLAQRAVAANADSSGKGPLVGFRYENEQLQPAKYSLVIHKSGAGEYHSEPAATPPPDTASYHPMANALDRSVQISKPVLEQIFLTAREQKFFAIPCEDTKDKVAFQGTKQLSYQGPDGVGSCSYNWSKLLAIQKLTAIFESIAFTLEEGRRLEVEQKHDRLAVDAELGVLVDAVKDGRAIELQNIQETLQAIIGDEAIMERARARAQKLLEGATGERASWP